MTEPRFTRNLAGVCLHRAFGPATQAGIPADWTPLLTALEAVPAVGRVARR